MGTDPWYFLRAIGLGIFILLSTGIPTLALAQPQDELIWKSITVPGTNSPILYLFGSIATLEGVRRLYSTLGRYKNDTTKEDDAMQPEHGITVRGNLKWFIEKMKDVKDVKYSEIPGMIRQDTRITPDAPYQLNRTDRERLARLCAILIDEFETLSTTHGNHVEILHETTEKLRDLMALPDEETLENMLQHTEELLKFAKGIKREFNQWFPEETNTTLDNVIQKLEEHFTASQQIEENERLRWEAALRTCLPKAYHQLRPGPGQEPLIPSLWASGIQACLDAADSAAQKVRNQVALLSQQVTAWEQIGRTTQYNNNIVSPDTAAPIIAKWKARADYNPLFSWMKISAAEQDKVLSGQQLKETMEAAMVAWLDQTNQNIPDKYRDTATEDFADRLNNSILQLRKGINRMTKFMSGVTTTTTTVTETDADQLRNTISPKYFPASGPLNYDQLLAAFAQLNKERLDAITQGKQPAPGPAPCRHPEDLSLVLTHDDNQEWDDSIGQVQDLLDQLAQQQPPAQGNIDERLFSSSDVPKLGDSDDYWTYRRSFEIFASSAVVAPRQISAAVARILNRFEGHRRSVMMAYDVNANIKLTWTATWKALLTYMDARFLPTNAHQELYVKWITLRRSDSLWGQSFITEFDRIRMTLNQIAPIKGQAPLDDLTTLSRLMDKLPGPVRETFRNKHRDYETRLLATPPTANIYNVYDWIIEDWEYLRNMGMLKDGQGKKADHKKSGPRSSAANPPANNAPPPNSQQPLGTSGNRTPLFGHCNKPCFDTAPAISINDRRKASDIFDHLKNANLCFSCRRPAEDHNGPKIGCQLHGSHRNHNATRRAGAPQPDFATDPTSNAASTSGNDSGDN